MHAALLTQYLARLSPKMLMMMIVIMVHRREVSFYEQVEREAPIGSSENP